MTSVQSPVSPAERERLENCAREPIRRPGSIQPHGVLVTADPSSWTVLQASRNCDTVLGVSADDLLGTSVAGLLGARAVERLSAVLAGARGAANPVPVESQGRHFDAIVHRADGVVVLELEPTLPDDDFASVPAVYAAVSRLRAATTRDELWADAARELQELTGFDRVMVYHFHADGHGQVVAEERADPSMEPYLGLHYPASDIPAQARALYLTKLSRTIFSTAELAYPLCPVEVPRTGQPLDLSHAELRSVSAHHLQFMRNMGQASTLSFSLIVGGQLIGMVTCAHRTLRRLPYTLRQGLEVFADQVAAQLHSFSEIGRLARTAELLRMRNALVEQFTLTGSMAQSLLHGTVTVLDLVPAAAAVLRHDGLTSTTGDLPDTARVEQFVERLRADGGRLPFASDSLAIDRPELATLLPTVAGVLIVPIDGGRGYLAWFRHEITDTTEWLGDQSESNRDSTLSPRKSFSAWSSSVSAQAEPWQGLDEEAAQFSRDLDSAVLRNLQSDLAHFGFHDALTGLPNRRLLMDRIDHSLAGRNRGAGVALLFIDIDSFKAINDSLGHDSGDDALIRIAERLRSVTRDSDTVARLGGDEFVVVVAGSANLVTASQIASRVLEALRRPITVNDRPLRVTSSIGVAAAEADDTAVDLMRRADAAMYRAKRAGKDRIALG
jgi:chemotaxis family two-component system sensor kinase Cph1